MAPKVEYEYAGFALEIETWDYVYPAYPTLVEEIKAILPEGAEWVQEKDEEYDPDDPDDEEEFTPYYGVQFGEHFMYVLYDDESYVYYDPETEKEWGQVVEAVLAKMNEISIKVFEYPAVMTDDDM